MTKVQPKRVLFVDDEPPVLSLLQSLLRHANAGCEAAFADRAAKGLKLLEEQPFDVVISDMRMPEMTGVEFLEKVRDQYPRVSRVILSGYADQPSSLRSLTSVHQFLAKPFTLATLQNILGRLFSLDQYVADPQWQAVLGAIHILPTPQSLQDQLDRELMSSALTGERLGGILAQDVALTAKVLQIVNSAFFGAARPITLAKEGAQSLGVNLVRTLATTRLLTLPSAEPAPGGLSLEHLCQHGVNTGLYATRILSAERVLPDMVKAAFTGGVLHDVGKLVLATLYPAQYAQVVESVRQRSLPSWQAEQEVFGIDHAQVGAYLVALWGLPQTVVDAVAWHHAPSRQARTEFLAATTAVHVANALLHQPAGVGLTLATPGLDLAHLEAAGVKEQRLSALAQACARV